MRSAITLTKRCFVDRACWKQASSLSTPAPFRCNPSLAYSSSLGSPPARKLLYDGINTQEPPDLAHHFSRAKFRPITWGLNFMNCFCLGNIEEKRIKARELRRRMTSLSTLNFLKACSGVTDLALFVPTKSATSLVPTCTRILSGVGWCQPDQTWSDLWAWRSSRQGRPWPPLLVHLRIYPTSLSISPVDLFLQETTW